MVPLAWWLFAVAALAVVAVLFLRSRTGAQQPPGSTPEPPRVPYALPFVGNALAFGRDSQAFLQECQRRYGDVMRVKMMGQDYVFVLDPFSFFHVFRHEKRSLSFLAIVREFACQCFGAATSEFDKQNHEVVHKCVASPPKNKSCPFSLFIILFYFIRFFAFAFVLFLSLSF